MKDLHGDAITSVTLSSDGNYILTNSRDHTLKYVDIRKYQEIATFENDMYINGSNTNRATLNTNATYGAVGSRQGNVIIFEIKGEDIVVEEIYPDFHTASVNSIHWQPDASSFSSIDASGSLLIWE
jgi:autophagy-related protein 16